MAVAEFSPGHQCLGGMADGSLLVSPALVEPGRDPADPAVVAAATGDGWVVSGTKEMVPFADQADCLLVAALTGDEVGLFVVDKSAPQVEVVLQQTTSGLVEGKVVLTDAPAERLGTDGAPVNWLVQRCMAALSAVAVGVVSEALRLTAAYTSEREQFGRPIATFQAVGQRVGDAYIDTEAIRLTALQACWRLDQGLEASTEVAVAKYWAADGGQRVANAAQHLHGGMGGRPRLSPVALLRVGQAPRVVAGRGHCPAPAHRRRPRRRHRLSAATVVGGHPKADSKGINYIFLYYSVHNIYSYMIVVLGREARNEGR